MLGRPQDYGKKENVGNAGKRGCRREIEMGKSNVGQSKSGGVKPGIGTHYKIMGE